MQVAVSRNAGLGLAWENPEQGALVVTKKQAERRTDRRKNDHATEH